MKKGISVIICCYNSITRLRPTLEHLVLQRHIPTDEWEVLVIDNASIDNTAEWAEHVWQQLDATKPEFRVIGEPIPGLSNARSKGIKESKFDLVLFCDDDNWLTQNYLSDALKIMGSSPLIGVLGGKGIPVFEDEEPPYFWENQYHTLAVGKQADVEGDITDVRGVVYGAGMVVNKLAYERLFSEYQFQFQGLDRTGSNLISSGDHELCLALKNIGYRIYSSEDLLFYHFIPKNRTTIPYYKKLFTGFGMSYPLIYGYLATKEDFLSIKSDYRYVCLRCCKNIVVAWLKMFPSGYTYRNIAHFQQLCENVGMLNVMLKSKNTYRENFKKLPIFNLTQKATS